MDSLHNFSITIAGAGNVGSYLAIELFNAGCTIRQVYSRTLDHAVQLAEKVESIGVNEVDAITADSDFLIIALPDRIIVSFLEELHRKRIINGSKMIALSTAGAVHINELINAFPESGVLYPLQSFTKKTRPVAEVIPFCIEGSNSNIEGRISTLAGLISKDIRVISSNQRMVLHLAAVFACNFTNHMIAIADEIIANADLEFTILKPLIEETIQRLNGFSPHEMQTGPAIRKDNSTIDKHLNLLTTLGHDDLRAVYSIVSENIQKLNNKKLS